MLAPTSSNGNSIGAIQSKKEITKAIFEKAKDKLPQNLSESTKNSIASSLSVIPNDVSETLLVGNFINGISQSLQEAMMQLLPRAGAGVVIRKTGLIGADESILEGFEYLFAFILTTVLGVSLARPLSSILGIPHYELIGKPMHELEKQLGKELEIGTIRKQKVHITKGLLNKLSLAKVSLFLMLGFYCACTEFLSSSLKVLAVDKIFGTNNFYTISGLSKKTEENKDHGEHALDKARTNLKNIFISLPLFILSVLGATKFLAGNKTLRSSKFLNKASKLFDLSDKFGHPKTLVAISALTAGAFAYPSVARNDAEKLEVRFRVLLFSAPMAIFFKQVIGNILSGITGLSMGLGNILAPPTNYLKEVKEGSRNIFDLGLVGINKNKEEFKGRITELPQLKELKLKDPQKYEQALRTIHFMDHRAPYLMALIAGIGVSWINYLRTAKMHKEDMASNEPTQTKERSEQMFKGLTSLDTLL